MKVYTVKEVRDIYLDFHKSNGHLIIPSSSLVPKEDPTVLFNTAGMQPVISYLTGSQKYPGNVTRIANSQKCIRTDDIDEVGDNRHCTFFEMLGNWSFNDYFKSEIIPWSMEFMVDKLDLDVNRIFTTVYKGNVQEKVEEDVEAIALWKSEFEKYKLQDITIGNEYNFKQLKNDIEYLYTPNFEQTKYIIFDFDGVIADTKASFVEILIENFERFGFEKKPTAGECEVFIDNYFTKAKTENKSEFSSILTIALDKLNQGTIKPKIFEEFIEVVKSLQNTKLAIVTDNLSELVQIYLKAFDIEDLFDAIYDRSFSHSKIDKITKVSESWSTDLNSIYYITDTIRDRLELIEYLDEDKILAKMGGYNFEKTILNNFKFNQILFKDSDLLNIFKPKLKDVAELVDTNFIYRIRKMSGKDNWWGLPYRGPCGPCSEMYYLLNHNPIDFETSILPNCTLEQIEDFIENQIVEIGNNVFMMYEGEKDDKKEPIQLADLGMQNVDTGLGLERFLMAINGFTTVYEIDIFEETLKVLDKYSN